MPTSIFGSYPMRRGSGGARPTFGLSKIGETSRRLGQQGYAQTLPEYAPSHPNYQPVGGMQTLPLTPGNAARGPVMLNAGNYQTFPVGTGSGGGYVQQRQSAGPLGMGHSVQQRSAGAPPYVGMGDSVVQRSGSDMPAGGIMSVPSRPFGMTMPPPTAGGMLQRNGQPYVYPGSGNVYYRDDEYNPSPQQRGQDDLEVGIRRSYDDAAGSGPYDSPEAANRFGFLASRQPRALTPAPVGTVLPGGSEVIEENGRTLVRGRGYRPNAEEQRAGMLSAQGNPAGVYVRTGPPAYGLSPEMEQRRQETVARQATEREMLGAGRNIRANRQYGAPLRPDLFPRAEAAYAGAGQFGSAQTSMNALVNRNTIENDDGTSTIDYAGIATGLYDRFRDDPARAWKQFVDAGGTSADLQAAIDSSRPGAFSGGDPSLHEWLLQMQQSGNRNAARKESPLTGPGRAKGLGSSTLLTGQNQPGEPLPGYPMY